MEDIKQRLIKCFAVVFPDMGETEITGATQESIAVWDSVASITLVNVIEEEFEMQMDFDLVPELTSFDKVLEYLQERQGTAA